MARNEIWISEMAVGGHLKKETLFKLKRKLGFEMNFGHQKCHQFDKKIAILQRSLSRPVLEVCARFDVRCTICLSYDVNKYFVFFGYMYLKLSILTLLTPNFTY